MKIGNNPFPQPVSQQIWDGKYRLNTPNPDIPNDITVEDTWHRIAKACAGANHTYTNDKKQMNAQEALEYAEIEEALYYEALEDFKFLPAGRITAGAGSGRKVTLFNCYVMGTIPDDLDGIFTMLKEAALTMQQGGGIGYDFSPLRPAGAPVKGVDADASGPLTFMDVWDTMCRTIMSAGSRRGAMMATIDCDHPDIYRFINAKEDPNRLRMFNVSILATDKFMKAVNNDEDWVLAHTVKPAKEVMHNGSSTICENKYIYDVVSARELWETIMLATYNQAEPGVIFIDNINKMNNLWYCENIRATNPCGEQPLPPYGACLLGSLNLSKMVINAFKCTSVIDYELLRRITKTAVRMLDSVIDISLFPLAQQEAEAKDKRRMGIGVTGLADMLFMLGHKYGSIESQILTDKVMQTIANAAYEQSIDLAKTFGPCPAVTKISHRKQFCDSGFMSVMPDYVKLRINDHGIRNALLTSIAPTGTISLYAGNLSSGIEPVFAGSYTRTLLNDNGTKRDEKVWDYGILDYHKYREEMGYDKDPDLIDAIKDYNFVTAQTLSPTDHLKMQAAAQKWVDSSISKTINCPEDISFDDFQDIYLDAWKSGCKGCTTYRPNDVTGSILSVEPKEKDEPEVSGETVIAEYKPMERPDNLQGNTYKIKWGDKSTYVTMNDTVVNGKRIPFEIFINTKQTSHFQWTVGLTRMISAVFRRGGDVTFVIEQLKSVFDPNGGQFVPGKGYVQSFIALLGDVVETHLKNIGYIDTVDTTFEDVKEMADIIEKNIVPVPPQCQSCDGFNIVIESGCPICKDCGHSKCG